VGCVSRGLSLGEDADKTTTLRGAEFGPCRHDGIVDVGEEISGGRRRSRLFLSAISIDRFESSMGVLVEVFPFLLFLFFFVGAH
jgi:hypothetical protein